MTVMTVGWTEAWAWDMGWAFDTVRLRNLDVSASPDGCSSDTGTLAEGKSFECSKVTLRASQTHQRHTKKLAF
jgi:hypothetical protein